MTIRKLALLLAALFCLLGVKDSYVIRSQCRDEVYLPPIPGTPQDTAQTIIMVPRVTNTYRVCYDTKKGDLCGNALFSSTGGSSGQSVTFNTRGEFTLSSLTPATKYYWRTECLQDGRWRKGWDGSFVTTPSTGGVIKLLYGTDSHLGGTWIAYAGDTTENRIKIATHSLSLMAGEQNVHAYIDGGDTLYFHCKNPCQYGYTLMDRFNRTFGAWSIDTLANNETTAIQYGETRASMVLRLWWRALRFQPSIWSRGNHDVGGAYGDNGLWFSYTGGFHHQFRSSPWVTTMAYVFLPDGLASDGTFTNAAGVHNLSDGEGPYRFAPASGSKYLPVLNSCSGSRSENDYMNEWYVDTNSVGSPTTQFRLAYTATDAPCMGVGYYGSGFFTLVRGSDMKHSTSQVRLKYLPNQNDVLAHGWGPDEDGIMGPVLLSDYIMVLNLDEQDASPNPNSGQNWPQNRGTYLEGAWTLGADTGQMQGALDLIDDLGPGSTGGYSNIRVLLIVMHHTLGGHSDVGIPYARGTLCESDTKCVDGGGDCTDDADCGPSDICQKPKCDTDDLNVDEMQDLHEAVDAFVTRASGIGMFLVGHDHQVSGGKKDNVYYYTGGQLGQDAGGWVSNEEHEIRYDFDMDGIPAYRKSYGKLGKNNDASGKQNFPTEWGTEHSGYTRLEICPPTGFAGACASGKAEVKLEYVISDIVNFPELSGTNAFSYTIQGP